MIEELVLACRAGENVKARCYVSVIGYGGFGERVDCVVDGMISEVASALIAVKKVKKRILNGAGGVIEVDVESQHWKAQTNTHRPTGQVFGVTFSPDGTTLASASADRTIRLWH